MVCVLCVYNIVHTVQHTYMRTYVLHVYPYIPYTQHIHEQFTYEHVS